MMWNKTLTVLEHLLCPPSTKWCQDSWGRSVIAALKAFSWRQISCLLNWYSVMLLSSVYLCLSYSAMHWCLQVFSCPCFQALISYIYLSLFLLSVHPHSRLFLFLCLCGTCLYELAVVTKTKSSSCISGQQMSSQNMFVLVSVTILADWAYSLLSIFLICSLNTLFSAPKLFLYKFLFCVIQKLGLYLNYLLWRQFLHFTRYIIKQHNL